MKQTIETLSITTTGRGLYEITNPIRTALSKSCITSGALTLHIMHTSASLLIQENADPEVQHDLERFFTRLCPDGDPLLRHTSEGTDDMPAHIRSALTSVNTTIPIQNGRLMLGTWQGIYLWEHRTQAHRRRLALYISGK